MANTLPSAMILPMGLAVQTALRENAGILGVVQKDMQNVPAGVGETATVGFAQPLTASDVTPAATISLPADLTLKQKQVALSAWKKAEFALTSRDEAQLANARGSWVPQQLTEAVRAVLAPARTALYGAAKKFSAYVKTSQSQMFNSTDILSNLTNARKQLNLQLAARSDRVFMMSADEEAAALNLSQFLEAAKSGDQSNPAFREGYVGKVLGFETHAEDTSDLPATHTAGTGASYVLNGAHAKGATNIVVKTGTGTLLAGDIVKIGNFFYSIVTGIAAPGTAVIAEPGLLEAASDSATVTLQATHKVQGYAFRPQGMMLVGRMPMQEGALGIHQAVRDPITGLMVKLSMLPGDECVIWRVSMLYGADVIDPRQGARLASA